jgi:hypothetical protein
VSPTTDIVGRIMAAPILKRTNYRENGQVFRFWKVQVTRVDADSARLSLTPATVSAEVSALKVILPR